MDDASTIRRFRASERARAEQETTVAALREPATYPGESGPVDAIETHMSWVFRTRDHAYKLKKPLHTDYYDYATRASRRRACERELQLNRRLAPDVYLAVVPVIASDGRRRVGTQGEAVDWLVKMRRLGDDAMLATAIEDDAVDQAAVDGLAETLLEFYEAAEPADWNGTYYRRTIESDVEAKCRSLARPRYGLDERRVVEVLDRQRAWLRDHQAMLQERAAAVVDCHGDLRPEHVCLEDPPVVIDCLDFDRSLRLLDPASELSFLALECRRLGSDWIGDRLLGAYRRERSFPDELIGFHQTRHAVIRAALAVWHLDDDALVHSDGWRERANWYLDVALELLGGAMDAPDPAT